jgi:hypothetical protein
MKKLIIDRSRWRTGGPIPSENITGRGSTALQNDIGYMCCLGFWCQQAGVPQEIYRLTATPGRLYDHMENVGSIVPELIDSEGNNTALAQKLMGVNDDSYTTPEQKEERIIKELALLGMEVEFTGKYTRNT